MSEAPPRRLRGHKGTATCCIASNDRPGLIATSGEDGCVCWFDMRCKDVVSIMEVGKEPISSICFKPGNEDVIYISSGKEIKSFDVHQASSSKPLGSYSYNKEEINQVSCSPKATFLAAADDGGDVKIIDIHKNCPYKTLRSGHTSICSSVQFLPWRPWEVITGGLDSKLIMWDFSRGRPIKVLDFGLIREDTCIVSCLYKFYLIREKQKLGIEPLGFMKIANDVCKTDIPDPDNHPSSNTGQCFNPAFIHAIAVPEVNMVDKLGQICVVARGDGIVHVIDIESEKSKISSKTGKRMQTRSKGVTAACDMDNQKQNGRKRLYLDYTVGGHSAAVSCVAFSQFGEKGKFIVSGGNDKCIKLWNWAGVPDAGETGSSNNDILHLNINLSKKVNWLCTTSETENLIVCDTSKIVKVYNVA